MADLVKLGREMVSNNSSLLQFRLGLGAKLSNLVFALRLEKGWTQKQFAEKLGVSSTTVYKMDGGSKEISIELYEKALITLGMTYEEMDELINFKKNTGFIQKYIIKEKCNE